MDKIIAFIMTHPDVTVEIKKDPNIYEAVSIKIKKNANIQRVVIQDNRFTELEHILAYVYSVVSSREEDAVEEFQSIETQNCSECEHYEDHHTSLAEDCGLIKFIIDAPSVVPTTEQSSKIGRWAHYMGDLWTCTCCGESLMCDDIECNNYCPNCGAKMKGEEDRMWTPQTDCDNCAESGSYKCTKCDGEMYYKTDIPQTGCDTCKHYKLTCDLFSEICKYEPITQAETQNSKLTFEKAMEEIQTQTIEFPDTHQKFTFARKIEMDGDSIKIGDWEYKGADDGEDIQSEAE